MNEDLTPEQKLEKLIIEGNIMVAEGHTVLVKLRKTLNGFLYVGIPTIALFLGSYWYNNNRMTTMENTRMTDEKLEEKFATKSGVVFLQNNIQDLNIASYKTKDWIVPADVEREYNKALKQFTGDISRNIFIQ